MLLVHLDKTYLQMDFYKELEEELLLLQLVKDFKDKKERLQAYSNPIPTDYRPVKKLCTRSGEREVILRVKRPAVALSGARG